MSNSASKQGRSHIAMIIAAIVALAVLVGTFIGFKMMDSPSSAGANGEVRTGDTANGGGVALYDGKIISAEKVAELRDKGTPMAEIYYDFTCNFCNDLEQKHADEIAQIISGGKAIFVYHPVITHNGPGAIPAGSFVLWTAVNQPQHFLALNNAILEFTSKNWNTQSLQKLSDLAKNYDGKPFTEMEELAKTDANAKFVLEYSRPEPVFEEIAKKVGVDPNQLEKILVDYQKNQDNKSNPPLLIKSVNAFMDRFPDKAATPMVLVNGKNVPVNTEFMDDPQALTKALNK